MMAIWTELAGDFLKMMATIGIIVGFVLLMWLWGATGIIGVAALLLLAGIGFALYWYWKRGMM